MEDYRVSRQAVWQMKNSFVFAVINQAIFLPLAANIDLNIQFMRGKMDKFLSAVVTAKLRIAEKFLRCILDTFKIIGVRLNKITDLV